jgi:cysteine dioxygenase
VRGECDAREDQAIHQVSNLQPRGVPLVTLHVYSPPLARMNVYSVDPSPRRAAKAG